MAQNSSPNIHQTTQVAIQILDYTRKQNGAQISDLTSEFDISRSTMYTHLNTLTDAGLLVRKNGAYWIGLRFNQFSAAALSRDPSYQLVIDELSKVENETDAELEFLVEEMGRLNHVYHSENVDHSRLRLYLHNTASGKAILAALPENRVTEIIDREGLPNHTENTITDRDELLAQLNCIRDRGYAINNGESFDGYIGIGASIEALDGSVLGGISIGGPVYHISKEQLRNEMVDKLLVLVERIEETIQKNRTYIATELANQN